MERLTKRVGNTVDFANGKANLKDHKANVKLLFKRLAEYEDTGLTPNQIYELAKTNYKHQEIIEELEEKLVKLQNECDEWKGKTKKLINAGNVLNGLTKELMRYCQECILGEVEERDKERKPIQ